MTQRIATHLRHNTIAYVALFFALGGGGAGAAIAATATSSSTIHACVSKKTGAIYIAKRCGKTTKALTFNQRGPRGATGAAGAAGATGPAGTPAVVVYGGVGDDGVPSIQQGLTITQQATGTYSVTITASNCQDNVPVVTPVGGGPDTAGPEAGIPVAYVTGTETSGASFDVNAGDIQNGTLVASDQGFNIQVQCG